MFTIAHVQTNGFNMKILKTVYLVIDDKTNDSNLQRESLSRQQGHKIAALAVAPKLTTITQCYY